MDDVLIVGAGPAGLTLAIDLVRRGVGVVLIERQTIPMSGSKGKGLQPRSLELFDDLGIVDEVLRVGKPYPTLRFYAGRQVVRDEVMFEQKPASVAVPYPNTIMLPQGITETILRRRLLALGGQIRFGAELIAFVDRGSHVTATVRDTTGEAAIHVRYLVGADGGHSTVRKLAGIALEGQSPDLPGMMVADLSASGLDRDYWHIWASSPTDMVGLVPLPGTDQFQFNAICPLGAEAEPSLAAMQAELDAHVGGSEIVLSHVTWTSSYRPNVRMAERFRLGNVFLIGDAAHVHPPTGGQGLNTSIQDACNLGWKLGAVLQGANPSLLDTYEDERLPVAAWVLGLSESLLRRGYSGDPEAMRRGADEQQLGLNYRHSLLSDGTDVVNYLQPGDRMPDGVLADGNRIFDRLRGTGFVRLQLADAIFAVRPDGYIGGIFRDHESADAYIRRFGMPR